MWYKDFYKKISKKFQPPEVGFSKKLTVWEFSCSREYMKSRSFENSYIPENPRTPKPLTFSKNRLRGAKNRSNISPVAKKNFRKNDFFFSKNFAYVQKKKICICAQSLYSTYLKGLVKKNLKENAKKKKLHICTKIKKKLHICKSLKKISFFRNFFSANCTHFKRFGGSRSRFFERNNGLGDIGNWGSSRTIDTDSTLHFTRIGITHCTISLWYLSFAFHFGISLWQFTFFFVDPTTCPREPHEIGIRQRKDEQHTAVLAVNPRAAHGRCNRWTNFAAVLVRFKKTIPSHHWCSAATLTQPRSTFVSTVYRNHLTIHATIFWGFALWQGMLRVGILNLGELFKEGMEWNGMTDSITVKKGKAIADAYNSPDEDFALQNLALQIVNRFLAKFHEIHIPIYLGFNPFCTQTTETSEAPSSVPPTGPTPPYLFTQTPKPKPLHEIHMGIPRFLLCTLARLLRFRCQFQNTPARPSPIMARSSMLPNIILKTRQHNLDSRVLSQSHTSSRVLSDSDGAIPPSSRGYLHRQYLELMFIEHDKTDVGFAEKLLPRVFSEFWKIAADFCCQNCYLVGEKDQITGQFCVLFWAKGHYRNMDQYFEVDSFRSLCCGQRWFNFTCARVVCVWRDYARNRLIIMFVDKNRKNDGCCSDIVNAKVLVKPVKEFTNEGVYTSNVVYREVLHDI
ncbi:hypothetical protein LXL04_038328 [Taraxacum kok-saghyz]